MGYHSSGDEISGCVVLNSVEEDARRRWESAQQEAQVAQVK